MALLANIRIKTGSGEPDQKLSYFLRKRPPVKKHLPNLLTMLNLFCGCLAVMCAARNALEIAAFFVCLGIFFDFFDGFLARKLNVQSDLGVQLDSLADMVTSGLVPGIVMFQLFNLSEGGGMEYRQRNR